jgi:hypothetical protein
VLEPPVAPAPGQLAILRVAVGAHGECRVAAGTIARRGRSWPAAMPLQWLRFAVLLEIAPCMQARQPVLFSPSGSRERKCRQ